MYPRDREEHSSSSFRGTRVNRKETTMKVKIDMRTFEVIAVEFDTEVKEDLRHMNEMFKNEDGECLTQAVITKILENGVRA